MSIALCLFTLALSLVVSTGGVEARRAVCKTYDQADFSLLTGIDSAYGGTFCTRH
jgi:hypothetical protein